MARPITTRRPSGQRINGSAAPAMALATPTTPWLRNAVLTVATGIAALAAGQLSGHLTAGWAALIASVPLAVLIGAQGKRKQLRRQLADRLLQAVAPQLGLRSLDRRAVNLTRWSRGWPGTPTQLVLRYAPGLDDVDPQWQHDILTTTSRLLLERYRIDVITHQRCWLRLQLADPVKEEDSAPAVQVRAERTISELIGPTAAITRTEFVDGELVLIEGHHQAGAKLAASGYRARIERVLSTMLPGRWRAHWDMENDGFRFELRPSFPASIWLPVSTNPDGHDVLASYDSLAIPYGVDEDGEVMVWRPAIDPNLMLVGAPGVGKSLATSTPIPTPSGWTSMGELADGDVVFDDRGRPCTVVTAHPVRHDRPCYRVAFSDGSTVLVDGEHLWSTSTIAERTSRRRWEARRHEDQRPTRMSTEQLAVVRTAVEHCAPDDLISVPEAACLAGIRPSAPVLRQLRRQLPVAGQRLRPMHDFSYAEQVVESVQTVNAYPRRPLLEQIAAAVAAGRGSLPPQRAQHLLQLASVDNNDLISTSQLKQLLDPGLPRPAAPGPPHHRPGHEAAGDRPRAHPRPRPASTATRPVGRALSQASTARGPV